VLRRNLGLERRMRQVAQEQLDGIEIKARPQPNPVWLTSANCGHCSQPTTIKITTSPNHNTPQEIESDHKCRRG
jgi:hypothetical protein